MNEKTIGYHGTRKDNENNIIEQGFEESKANLGHWLGRGIYFYENIYYAIEWGIIHFLTEKENYDKFIEQCSVLKAIIDISKSELLDLNDPVGYAFYLEILEEVKTRFPNEIKKIENNNGDIEIIRLLEKIEEKTGQKYISMFDVVTADYPKDIYKKENMDKRGDFLPCIQKQICVKNSEVIDRLESVNLSEEPIREYFNIIVKNRKENENDKQSKNTKKIARKNKKHSG